jgi:BirA family transcriptional regulator, biotin operon repressor / biotin---[acetyl-CoA-carboxylase] ligase
VDQSRGSTDSWDAAALSAALVKPAGPWVRLDVVDRVGSTNAELLAAAAAGAPDRAVLVARHQDAGRGRLGRDWVSPLGTGLTVSVLLRPDGVSPDRYGWLPLLAGLAVHDAVGALMPARTCLKWPNDLLLGSQQRKAAGILAEATTGPDGTAVVLGIGLNLAGGPDDLPDGATSLAAEGAAALDRTMVLVAVLSRLAEREASWRDAAGDPDADRLRADYRAACGSLGAEVRVELPGGMTVTGMAEDVDGDGRLLLLGTDGQRRAIAAGDVVHVRPIDRSDPGPSDTGPSDSALPEPG